MERQYQRRVQLVVVVVEAVAAVRLDCAPSSYDCCLRLAMQESGVLFIKLHAMYCSDLATK